LKTKESVCKFLTTTDLLSLDGGLVPRRLASYSSGSASATRASYYQLDALGSGRAVTGAGGAVQGDFASFGDFGKALTTTDQPLTPSYTGYEHDAYTGLEYAKNRYYDPATASFISSDPYPVDYSDLLGMNLYNYVQGNPVNSTDPLGWFNWATQITETGDSRATIWLIAKIFSTSVENVIQDNPILDAFVNPIPGIKLNLPPCTSANCYLLVTQSLAEGSGTVMSQCGVKECVTFRNSGITLCLSNTSGENRLTPQYPWDDSSFLPYEINNHGKLVISTDEIFRHFSQSPIRDGHWGNFGGKNTLGGDGLHAALDSAWPSNFIGNPIYPTNPGKVVFASTWSSFGNVIAIEHNIYSNLYYSVYAHLESILVNVGQLVSYNTQIGKLGRSGLRKIAEARGRNNYNADLVKNDNDPNKIASLDTYIETEWNNITHLHFEVRKQKNYNTNGINPFDNTIIWPSHSELPENYLSLQYVWWRK
jgi:RHS repeat-associated protein